MGKTYFYDYVGGNDSLDGLSKTTAKRNLPASLFVGDTHLLRDGVTAVAQYDIFIADGSIIDTWDGGIASFIPTGSSNSVSIIGKTGVKISNLRFLGGAGGSRQVNVSGVIGVDGLVFRNIEFDGQDQVLWNLRIVNCPGSVRLIDCTVNAVKQDCIYAENCGGLTLEGLVASNPNGANDFSGDCLQIGSPGTWGFLHVGASRARRSSFSNLRNGKQGIIFGGLNCLDILIEDSDFFGGFSCLSLDTPTAAPVIRRNTFKAYAAMDARYTTQHLLLLKNCTDAFVVDNVFAPLGISIYSIENWNPVGTTSYYGNSLGMAKTWGIRHYGNASIASRMVLRSNLIDSTLLTGDPLASTILCGPGHEYTSSRNTWSVNASSMLNVASIVYPTLASAQAAGFEQGSTLKL